MAGHGSPRPEDKANHPNRKVAGDDFMSKHVLIIPVKLPPPKPKLPADRQMGNG